MSRYSQSIKHSYYNFYIPKIKPYKFYAIMRPLFLEIISFQSSIALRNTLWVKLRNFTAQYRKRTAIKRFR